MFRLNKVIKTKDGQEVTPFLVEGQKVYCFGSNKETIIKYLDNFDFEIKEQITKSEMVSITPIIEITDELHEPEDIKPVIEEIGDTPVLDSIVDIPIIDTSLPIANEDYI